MTPPIPVSKHKHVTLKKASLELILWKFHLRFATISSYFFFKAITICQGVRKCDVCVPGTLAPTYSVEPTSGSVRVQFRVRFQTVKVPMFGGFALVSPIEKATASKLSSKGPLLVRVRFGEVPSTVEEVIRVRFCCLLSRKTNTGNTGRTVLGLRPTLAKFTTLALSQA